jgi:hypothetical protein
MTFSLPVELADRISRRFPSQDRSRRVAMAIEQALNEEDARLVEACRIANADVDGQELERDWDVVQDLDLEPWNDASAR